MDAIFFQRLDDNMPMLPRCDEHGVIFTVDDAPQLIGHKNCDAEFNLYGNHPFLFVVSANNHRVMVISRNDKRQDPIAQILP